MTTTTPKNLPFDSVRLGVVQAAIWRNIDREGRPRYSVTTDRRYNDGKGNWKSTDSFDRDDLLVLAKVADMANSRIYELQARDRGTANAGNDSPSPSPITSALAAVAEVAA